MHGGKRRDQNGQRRTETLLTRRIQSKETLKAARPHRSYRLPTQADIQSDQSLSTLQSNIAIAHRFAYHHCFAFPIDILYIHDALRLKFWYVIWFHMWISCIIVYAMPVIQCHESSGFRRSCCHQIQNPWPLASTSLSEPAASIRWAFARRGRSERSSGCFISLLRCLMFVRSIFMIILHYLVWFRDYYVVVQFPIVFYLDTLTRVLNCVKATYSRRNGWPGVPPYVWDTLMEIHSGLLN